jgi:surfactin synthase thioesterase subunit
MNERPSLVSLPFAGAGASIYSDWERRIKGAIRVIALQPAGKEKRISETPFTSVHACVGDLLPTALEKVGNNQDFGVFGHSLGAILAFELTRSLIAAGLRPKRLFVSGSPGPLSPRTERASGLEDAEFLKRVAAFAGYEHPALEIPELRSMIMPSLRADVQMHEDYLADTAARIDVPITAIRGDGDTLVSDADISMWSQVTQSGLEVVNVRGGHMSVIDAVDQLLDVVMIRLLSP